MIIAVNTRLLLKDRIEGIGRFSIEILQRLTKQHPEHTFLFLFDRRYHQQFIFSNNVKPIILWPQSRHPFLWYIFFECSVKNFLKKHKADVYITMDGWMPLNTEVRILQVLHDLHYEYYPEFLPFLTRKYYQFFFQKFAKRADRIITVSHTSKKEICQKYAIADELVDVVYNSSENFREKIPETRKRLIREKYSGSANYFLVLGSIHERKNTAGIIEAFKKFKHLTNSDFKLVIVGRKMWRNHDKETKKSKLDEEIMYTGYVSDDELHVIISSAFALLFCSFYEGFGIPILEAMSCGVPVITSNRSAMPEVAGDAAVFIDPESVGSMANAMVEIYNNPELHKALTEKGQANLKRFSWDKSALIFWDSIVKVTTG